MYKSKKMSDEFEDKSMVLSITIFCFKWKQLNISECYLSYLEQEETGIDKYWGFIFKFTT